MKITRRQLYRIINEEVRRLDEYTPVALVWGAGILGTLLAGSALWALWPDDKKEKIMALVTRENIEAAFGIYMALKGMGTDEDTVNQLLNAESIPKTYGDFSRVLQIMGEDTDESLEDWLRGDGMHEMATKVQDIVELFLQSYKGSARIP